PTATQTLFAFNQERIAHKPYAKYFNGDLWLHDDVLPALQAPMAPKDMLSSAPNDLATLLTPGHHAVETGFGITESGTPYVTSLTHFPGCTPEMFTWWFWWHSVEPERYSLWYPYNHVAANPRDRAVLTAPGLTDAQRYIGNTHDVTEYLGPQKSELVIHFVEPEQLGFNKTQFDEQYAAHACAEIEGGVMLHLVRSTDDGFELRSRYIFDRSAPPAGTNQPETVDGRRAQAEAFAYELLIHDQTEFTHLSTFLAPIYEEFGTSDEGQ
ncbi:TPA: hypothetical protein IYE61_002782, partial [Enterococcus faecium]|nr:hypothetical protein [Enterococcus faecium]